jgi:galactokinase
MSRKKLKDALNLIYGYDEEALQYQVVRFSKLIDEFSAIFQDQDIFLFSTPGRTELAGNHTDHNNGRVLAAAVNLDTIAAVARENKPEVTLYSEGYDHPFMVSLEQLEPRKEEKGTTSALIRGIAAGLQSRGYQIGGFKACMTSDVLVGSGLSSSASVEVLIGTIFNHLYNSGKILVDDIAIIGQYAENQYFGKPCGLMDQIACAVGGIVEIDFKNPQKPVIQKVDFNFAAQDYSIIVVDTGGNHADLTVEYAAIPEEMRRVANQFQAEVCRELDPEVILQNIPNLREKLGDRPVLRALHFLAENERVSDQVSALEAGNFKQFLSLVNESGNSSFKWLQNCYTPKNPSEQGLTLALALTENFLKDKKAGACRVHGGGFAGTIQVFMPNKYIDSYQKLIKHIFGDNSLVILNIRTAGSMFLGKMILDTLD